jgi:hypothetical protein
LDLATRQFHASLPLTAAARPSIGRNYFVAALAVHDAIVEVAAGLGRACDHGRTMFCSMAPGRRHLIEGPTRRGGAVAIGIGQLRESPRGTDHPAIDLSSPARLLLPRCCSVRSAKMLGRLAQRTEWASTIRADRLARAVGVGADVRAPRR